jgi:cobalt-zinc-cadmium efflux system membrane fusion protein
MKKIIVVTSAAVIILVVAAVSSVLLGQSGASSSAEASVQQQQRKRTRNNARLRTQLLPALSSRERANIDIQLAEVKRQSIRRSIAANGVLRVPPDKVASIGPVVSGRISEVLASLGDWVDKGQAVAKLVSVEISDAVSEYYKAVEELELARLEYERYQRLISQDIGAKKDLYQAETAYKIAQTNLNAAEKSLHALGFTEENVTQFKETHTINAELAIRSPIQGRITERDITVGQRVSDESNLFVVMDIRKLNVDAQVYERDISSLQIGQDTLVKVNSLTGVQISSKLTYIGQSIDESTRTLTIRAVINNTNERLKVGMFCNVTVFTGSEEPMLCVPISAVLEDKNSSYVFIERNGEYELREVITGCSDGSLVEIVDGLSEGDQAVIAGNYTLFSIIKQEGSSLSISR